jgi:hypothetical protein
MSRREKHQKSERFSSLGSYILRGRKPVPVNLMTMEGKLAFARCVGDVNSRRVAATRIGRVWFSTAFMCTARCSCARGEPDVFETAVFIDGEHFRAVARYSRWSYARRGHRIFVKAFRDKIRKRLAKHRRRWK